MNLQQNGLPLYMAWINESRLYDMTLLSNEILILKQELKVTQHNDLTCFKIKILVFYEEHFSNCILQHHKKVNFPCTVFKLLFKHAAGESAVTELEQTCTLPNSRDQLSFFSPSPPCPLN
jgi:hypothetical protein